MVGCLASSVSLIVQVRAGCKVWQHNNIHHRSSCISLCLQHGKYQDRLSAVVAVDANGQSSVSATWHSRIFSGGGTGATEPVPVLHGDGTHVLLRCPADALKTLRAHFLGGVYRVRPSLLDNHYRNDGS